MIKFPNPLGQTAPIFLLTLLLTGLLHFLMATGFELSTDEAHYALYANFPALSYFDHPPLVGWAHLPVQWLYAPEQAPDVLLRLVPILSYALTLGLLVNFAFRQFGHSAARWTALILAVAPLPHMLGAAQVPDTLLMLWGACLLTLTARLCRSNPVPQDWYWLGITLGLAGLSKYTAILLVPPMLVCLLRAHGLRPLKTPHPWIAVLLALSLISPVILWNAQHEWISFAYQGAHGSGKQAWQFTKSLQQTLIQITAYGPLLTLLPLVLLRKTYRPGTGICLALALPFLGILLFLAGRSNALPHWTAPAWVLLAPLAGLAASQLSTQLSQRVIQGLLGFQALLCVLIVAWMLSGGTPDPHGLKNPPADLYGWQTAGRTAQRLASEKGISHLAVQNWSIASRLAWYAAPLPVHVLDTRFDQFDLWYGDLPEGQDALLVDWSPLPFELPVGPRQFTRCLPLTQEAVERNHKVLSFFHFFHCQSWGGRADPVEKQPS